MMLNKMPPNTPISLVLSHLETATKWGRRNRAMFALRQLLRIRDISVLQVSDVLGYDGKLRSHYISDDGIFYELDDEVKDELHRYLLTRFELEGNSLKDLVGADLDVPLFPTQKRERFSNNTLAQHFCYLDKSIWQHFVVRPAVKKASLSGRLMTTLSTVK
jgi:hypothetical protein